jgi:hypothetical protein
MDHIEKESRLKADGGPDVCGYTSSDDQAVTHVYLPHLIRDTDSKCQKFRAHRVESEIARILKSRTISLRSTSRAQHVMQARQ